MLDLANCAPELRMLPVIITFSFSEKCAIMVLQPSKFESFLKLERNALPF